MIEIVIQTIYGMLSLCHIVCLRTIVGYIESFRNEGLCYIRYNIE